MVIGQTYREKRQVKENYEKATVYEIVYMKINRRLFSFSYFFFFTRFLR